MNNPSPVLAILPSEQERETANQLAVALGYPHAHIIIGTPATGALHLSQQSANVKYILIDIGHRGQDVLAEIDQLTEHCSDDVRVVVVGHANDIGLYRALIGRGILEYFNYPLSVAQLRATFTSVNTVESKVAKGKLITFMSAASGDGASTVALNTAYCLSRFFNKSTVIIDMDFQFGMIARNLDLNTPFGIRELLEHADRSVDETLVNRMLADYKGQLKIMAAPNDLRLWPDIRPEVMRELIETLKQRFDYVVMDLPHIWSSWLATSLSSADHTVIVAQLWLRSVTHTARLLGVWRDIGIVEDRIFSVINRSGAKFKEAVSAKDYENVCRKKIDYYISNDIKAIVAAENEGKTIPEIGNSPLTKQFRDLAGVLAGVATLPTAEVTSTAPKAGLSIVSVFNRK